jgi:hypothetical protein
MDSAVTSLKTDDDTQPFLVILGLDESNKAHAAWFAAADAELAERAAAIMKMKVLRVTTDEQRALASGLPQGRIFASGRGFVPFVKAATYERLNGFDGIYEPPMPVEVLPEPLPVVSAVPSRWEDIQTGSLVLASTEGKSDGWFEAIVVKAKGDDLFVLRWRDWAELEPIVRTAEHLGLLPPSAEIAQAT